MACDDEKQNEIAQLKARLAELEGEDSEEEENPFAKAEGDDEMGMDDMGMDSEMGDDSMDMGSDMGSDEESEDDMDLEAIIRNWKHQSMVMTTKKKLKKKEACMKIWLTVLKQVLTKVKHQKL